MTIEQRELDFRSKVNLMIAFPYELRKEFTDYWTEPNRSGLKMKYELEKTWDLHRRLSRWQSMGDSRKDFGGLKQPPVAHTSVKQPLPAPTNEVERLDQFLNKYVSRPGDIPFDAFGRWYDYMKAEKLLTIDREKGQELMEIYKGNKDKCRCAAVQITLDGYVKGGITFAEIFKMRLKLV